LAVPLSLLVAFASYRLVEAPFLRLRRRWSRLLVERDVRVGRAVRRESLRLLAAARGRAGIVVQRNRATQRVCE